MGPLSSVRLFDHTSELVFRQSPDQPVLGGIELVDDRDLRRATLRRDGAGFRVLLMNWVLEDVDRHPICFIRSPPPRAGIHLGGAFSLLRPDGELEGQLVYKAGLRESSCALETNGTETLVASKSALGANFEIRAGARLVASGHIDRLALPGGLHLTFPPPPAPELPRAPLVALTTFASLWWRGHDSSGWEITGG